MDAQDLNRSSKQGQKKKQKGSKSGSKGLWSSTQGWASIDAADELLLGAEEGGFAGLEVLEDVSLINADYLASLNQAAKQQLEEEAAADTSKPGKKSKKQQQEKAAPASGSKRKRAEAAAAAAGEGGVDEDVAVLKARLRQLEAENRALKKQKKKQPVPTAAAAGAGGAAPEEPVADATAAAAGAEGQPPKKSRKQLRAEKKKQWRLEQQQQLREQRAQAKAAKLQQRKQQELDGGTQQGAAASNDAAAAAAAAAAGVDMSEWRRFCLHPKLEAALAAQGFTSPTPIQDAVLLPAIRDRQDVIGAAQTGSGKTLAFGLPILQVLLQEQELQQLQQELQQEQLQQQLQHGGDGGEAVDGAAAGGTQQQQHGGRLRALILAPTRELALQVSEHLQALGKLVGIRVAALVGGIAPVKQERLLRACPPIVVATPGRLWDMIRHGHKHLSDLEQLSFFVLDEADRMVQQGHYQELASILELLPTPERAAAMAAAAAAEAAEQQRLDAAAAEHKRKQRRQQHGQESGGELEENDEDVPSSEDAGPGVTDDDREASEEQEAEEQRSEEEDEAADDADEAVAAKVEQQQKQKLKQQVKQQKQKTVRGRHHLLQTFVFSATLTLPAQLHKRLRRGGGGSSGAASLENLMDRLSFRDRPAVVDLSPSAQLAERVREGLLQTLEGERDAVLYYVLARHPGRALVFVNAVSAVRRVAALLQLLGLPAVALHAQQQQRQRLKALDRFKGHPHGVLVATDVAARGLDIRDVQIVVHYQLPASADTYIHRSGRTARTGGVDGVVLSMVTPADASRWTALRRTLEGQTNPPTFPIDDRVLGVAKQRVALAAKIDAIQRQARKAHAQATWARSNAEAAGIALSDSELEDEGLSELAQSAVSAARRSAGAGSGGKKAKKGAALGAGMKANGLDSQAAAERAHSAGQLSTALSMLQRQLAAALAAPLQPSVSHKFFTGGMSAAAVAAAAAAPAQAAGAEAAAGGNGGGDGGELAAAGGAEGGVFKPVSLLPVDAIAETVQLAARLDQSRAGQVAAAGGSGGLAGTGSSKRKQQQAVHDSGKARRKAVAALVAAAAAKGDAPMKGLAGVVKKVKKQGGTGPKQAAAQQHVLMARMLMSNNEKKRQRRQGGMVVVRPGAGGAFGRDAQGVSALDVLNMSK